MAIALQTYTDCIQPFLIHHSNIRGKMVRLNEVVDTILTRHDYPEAVSRLLAELIVIATILSANLKHKGLLTVQLKGDGPVRFMVVDATAKGEMRGYADLTEDYAAQIKAIGKNPTLKQLMGNGFLAITLHQGNGREPQQGIVALDGENLAEVVQSYFTTSEQNEVFLRIAVGRNRRQGDTGQWCAGGIMLQYAPHEDGIPPEDGNLMHFDEDPQEQWRRSNILTDTVKETELLDMYLPLQRVLYSLFNEDGVWVYEASDISVGCRCSRKKITHTLMQFPQEEVESMLEDGTLSVNCQFCNQAEHFSAQEVRAFYPAE